MKSFEGIFDEARFTMKGKMKDINPPSSAQDSRQAQIRPSSSQVLLDP